jgi:hypothetical protein
MRPTIPRKPPTVAPPASPVFGIENSARSDRHTRAALRFGKGIPSPRARAVQGILGSVQRAIPHNARNSGKSGGIAGNEIRHFLAPATGPGGDGNRWQSWARRSLPVMEVGRTYGDASAREATAIPSRISNIGRFAPSLLEACEEPYFRLEKGQNASPRVPGASRLRGSAIRAAAVPDARIA